jgi:hypothetical protein
MYLDSDTGSEARRRARVVAEVIVPDFVDPLAFHVDTGFDVERLTADFAALQGHGCRLFLARNPVARPAHGCNLRIIVDVDATYSRMRQIDALILREFADRGYGLLDFAATDPNGFVLRFAEVLDVTAS